MVQLLEYNSLLKLKIESMFVLTIVFVTILLDFWMPNDRPFAGAFAFAIMVSPAGGLFPSANQTTKNKKKIQQKDVKFTQDICAYRPLYIFLKSTML